MREGGVGAGRDAEHRPGKRFDDEVGLEARPLLLLFLVVRREASSILGLEGVGEKEPSGLMVLLEEEDCPCWFRLDAATVEVDGEVDGRGWEGSSTCPA